MTPQRTNTRFVLGIDIGGTKMDARLFPVVGGAIADTPVWKQRVNMKPNEKGLDRHTDLVVSLVEAASDYTDSQGAVLAGVGIGSPGRFRADGTIKPGTNTNMESFDGEFDDVNLAGEYRKKLEAHDAKYKDLALYVGNDGTAMLAGMLEAILHSKVELKDREGDDITPFSLTARRVGYFGIGTGIGHAIFDISRSGTPQPITDGHASKLRVEVDVGEDHDLLMQAKAILEQESGKCEAVICDDGRVRAEDLFRGPIVNAIADITGSEERAAEFAGKYMARTMLLIASGENEDVNPDNGWSETDRKAAASTSLYLIGGGMGESALGSSIIAHAREHLREAGYEDHIEIVQFKGSEGENVATHAAAVLVPENIFRDSKGISGGN